MSRYKAAALAGMMSMPLGEVPGLSPKFAALLKKAGARTTGQGIDFLLQQMRGLRKIKGIGSSVHVKILGELEAFLGAWPVGGDSYDVVAEVSFDYGLAEGATAMEEKYLRQFLKFRTSEQLTVERLKDRTLEAFERGNAYVATTVVFEYEIPYLGLAEGVVKLIFSAKDAGKLTRSWNPALREDVKGNCILKLDSVTPRECDFTLNFATHSGTLLVKPPSREAQERFERVVVGKILDEL